MRLASYRFRDETGFGAVMENAVVPLSGSSEGQWSSLRSAIAAGFLDSPPPIHKRDTAIDLSEIVLLPPIPDPAAKFVCVGLNYRDHREEARDVLSEEANNKDAFPTIFLRFADSHVAHGQPVLRPRESQMLDYECELAVIIGRPARRVEIGDALRYVAGFSCYNDFSVRDWQGHTSQWAPGKNFPGVGSFGPYLVTPDEVDDLSSVRLETRVNGELRQSSSVENMIFGVPELISYISTFTTLSPGDVIITGTPAGVGMLRDPPAFLSPGDHVEVDISGVGLLQNDIGSD
jgi:2-keto-4-pentenoate hydratase/2-oxohepta-3-ene-1,7-dioic acid hydratase in catechol pathway